jgi:hypothetical protein
MRSNRLSIRPGSISATAVLVLAALAATMPSPENRPAARVESRPAMSEAQAVRLIAAAVAAVARDLAGTERHVAALASGAIEFAASIPAVIDAVIVDSDPAPPWVLAERLLDLPPPTC